MSDNNISVSGPTTYSLKTPVRVFIIKSQREDLQGLEVGFDSEGYVGLRCVANNNAGFILTSEAALLLADLILREKKGAEGIYLAE